MFQDYQLEVYFPLNENQTVHYFTIWRDVRYTSALDFSSEFLQDIVLDGMVDWDKDTEAECQHTIIPNRMLNLPPKTHGTKKHTETSLQ